MAFDGQDRLGLHRMHEASELGVGVQGISRTRPLLNGARRQHLLGNRDFMGCLVHPHLEDRFLALMGHKRQQMGSDLFACSPHRLAIQGERLVSGSHRRRVHPASQHTLDGIGIHLGQKPLGVRKSRGPPTSCSNGR
jgi:hypothetical protein